MHVFIKLNFINAFKNSASSKRRNHQRLSWQLALRLGQHSVDQTFVLASRESSLTVGITHPNPEVTTFSVTPLAFGSGRCLCQSINNNMITLRQLHQLRFLETNTKVSHIRSYALMSQDNTKNFTYKHNIRKYLHYQIIIHNYKKKTDTDNRKTKMKILTTKLT